MEVEIVAACEGTALIFRNASQKWALQQMQQRIFWCQNYMGGPLCRGDPFLCMPTHFCGRKKVNSSDCDYEQGKQSSYLTHKSTIQNKSSKKGC